ncbi:uncharacterized protein [Periplaneta americana]|uniref:uncharacterized protein n=1 Tax=Periplaneta americana TaxID=6978 RepID=UPI0037E74303
MAARKTLSLLCVACFFVIADVGDCAGTTQNTINDFVTKIVDGVGKLAQNYSKVVEVAKEASNYVERELERPYSFLQIFGRNSSNIFTAFFTTIRNSVMNVMNFVTNVRNFVTNIVTGIFTRVGRTTSVIVKDVVIIIIIIALAVLLSILLCLCGLGVMAFAAVISVISITLAVGAVIFTIFQLPA